jgi:hypothetical protein
VWCGRLVGRENDRVVGAGFILQAYELIAGLAYAIAVAHILEAKELQAVINGPGTPWRPIF